MPFGDLLADGFGQGVKDGIGLFQSHLGFGGDQVDELDCFPVQEAVVETRRRLPVALDGEVVPMDSPLRYRIRPLDLNVLAP